MKAGGDASIKILLILFNNIWRTKEYPRDWKKSMYLPIYKKGDKKEYGNYRTIALIYHTSKIFLRIIQKRLEHFLIQNYLLNKQVLEREEEQEII